MHAGRPELARVSLCHPASSVKDSILVYGKRPPPDCYGFSLAAMSPAPNFSFSPCSAELWADVYVQNLEKAMDLVSAPANKKFALKRQIGGSRLTPLGNERQIASSSANGERYKNPDTSKVPKPENVARK